MFNSPGLFANTLGVIPFSFGEILFSFGEKKFSSAGIFIAKTPSPELCWDCFIPKVGMKRRVVARVTGVYKYPYFTRERMCFQPLTASKIHFTVDDIIGAAALLFIIGVIIFCKVCDWQNEHRSKKEQKNKDKKFREE